MKKISLLALACFCFAIVHAQRGRSHVELGVKGGVNLSKLDVANVNSTNINTRADIHLGILAHIHLNPNWAVQPEINYSSQGMKQIKSGDEYKWKLNYINVPVLVQYMINGGFRLETGPQLGFLTSAKIEDPNGNSDNLKNDLKGTDVSWSFGVGYLSPSHFGVDARYNLGLTDINQTGSNKILNRVWQIGVFYQFPNRF